MSASFSPRFFGSLVRSSFLASPRFRLGLPSPSTPPMPASSGISCAIFCQSSGREASSANVARGFFSLPDARTSSSGGSSGIARTQLATNAPPPFFPAPPLADGSSPAASPARRRLDRALSLGRSSADSSLELDDSCDPSLLARSSRSRSSRPSAVSRSVRTVCGWLASARTVTCTFSLPSAMSVTTTPCITTRTLPPSGWRASNARAFDGFDTIVTSSRERGLCVLGRAATRLSQVLHPPVLSSRCSGFLSISALGWPRIRPVSGSQATTRSLESICILPTSASVFHSSRCTRGSKSSPAPAPAPARPAASGLPPPPSSAVFGSSLSATSACRMTCFGGRPSLGSGWLSLARQEQPGMASSFSSSVISSRRISRAHVLSSHALNTSSTSHRLRPTRCLAGKPNTAAPAGSAPSTVPSNFTRSFTRRWSRYLLPSALDTTATCFVPAGSSRCVTLSETGTSALLALTRCTMAPSRQLVSGPFGGASIR
mmetsp:Transcript_43920/g.131660  ORF Transcript_43920/g.131660 Transcript_43920/m.131660 type:complete len:488 (-) Transcript_43920:1611-3074(-)